MIGYTKANWDVDLLSNCNEDGSAFVASLNTKLVMPIISDSDSAVCIDGESGPHFYNSLFISSNPHKDKLSYTMGDGEYFSNENGYD